MKINKMAIYEASFLGESKPIREKKAPKSKVDKKVDPKAEPEVPEVPEPPKAVRKRKAEPEVAPLPVPPKTKKAARAANKKVIVSGVEAEEAPAWFKAHMHAEAKRRNDKKQKPEKVTVPVLKAETEVAIAAKWNDGVTKEKVTKEVESHMDRLYKQIHGRK